MQQPITVDSPEVFSSEKETYYFDRKSARKDTAEIAKHISAFANAAGGKLVIGIEDDGTISGFKRDGAREIEDFKRAAITDCVPSPAVTSKELPVVNADGEDNLILVLDIAASTDWVIVRKRDNEVFLRQRDNSVKLDREQVRALEYDKNQRNFEEEVCTRSSLDDVDHEVLTRYKVSLGTDVSDEQLLRSRGFLVDGRLTNAGVLLFSDNPTRFLPCARVRVLKYEGSARETGSRMNLVKERTFDGPIPRVIDEAKAMVSSQLRELQFLGGDGVFKIIPEYPEFAWFEGLVNAVTHRNYAIAGGPYSCLPSLMAGWKSRAQASFPISSRWTICAIPDIRAILALPVFSPRWDGFASSMRVFSEFTTRCRAFFCMALSSASQMMRPSCSF